MSRVSERKLDCDHLFDPPVVGNGGMAFNISGKGLVRAVCKAGQELGINTIGTLPGTALPTAISRELQNGDPDEQLRWAFDNFPNKEMSRRVWDEHFIKGGRNGKPYRLIPMVGLKPRRSIKELMVVATFAEVWLARQGHNGTVAINFMEKDQTHLLYGILGAMLGGAHLIDGGAGLPDVMSGVAEDFVHYRPAEYPLIVDDKRSTIFKMKVDPAEFVARKFLTDCPKPVFAAKISTNDLAELLITGKLATGYIDALILEHYTAGGHNAIPRGAKKTYNKRGEYEYSERDSATYAKITALGLPSLWAGSFTGRLKEVIENGGNGIIFGTASALSRESNMREDIKDQLIEWADKGLLDVFADPLCSPTEYPLNVVQKPGDMSDDEAYKGFEKECQFGYLRKAFRDPKDGRRLIWRCFAEPEGLYLLKGGKIEDTRRRKCVCRGLSDTAGLEDNGMPLITLGRDIASLKAIIDKYGRRFTIKNVIEYIARDYLLIAA